jgi:hypothetical protein
VRGHAGGRPQEFERKSIMGRSATSAIIRAKASINAMTTMVANMSVVIGD